MGLLDQIKQEADKNGTKIQNTEEQQMEAKLNKLFYLEKDVEQETEFLRMVMTRGQETQERKGLHASAIIVSDDKFCIRQQLLSLFYKQKQGEQVPIGLKRIFSEGDAIHEKWQRLFIRGGYAKPKDCDYTRFNKQFELFYTPDILATIDGERIVVEVKSVNTYQFKKMKSHPSGKRQCFLYMYLTGIKRGMVLCEDKNTQDFKVFLYGFDYAEVQPYIARLELIQQLKQRLKRGKIVKRQEHCTGYQCKMAQSCPMQDVCYGKTKERL